MAENSSQFIGSLHFARHHLGRAQRLLALADSAPADSTVLAASAVLLIHFALEQALRGEIDAWRNRARVEENEELVSRLEELRGRPTRQKLKELPLLRSGQELELDDSAPMVRELHALITLRNALCHTEDVVIDREMSVQQFTVGSVLCKVVHPPEMPEDSILALLRNPPESLLKAKANGQEHVLVLTYIPENAWDSVSSVQATRFHVATTAYLEQVVYADRCISDGLLRPVRHREG